TSGFGVVSESGRMRTPSPAASTMARRGTGEPEDLVMCSSNRACEPATEPRATPSPLVGEGWGGGACRGGTEVPHLPAPPPTPPHKGEGRSSRHRQAST